MADILIRGMEMPKGCAECKLNSDTICVPINGCIYDESNGSNRRPDCPLVELPEHGDLIDRVAFRAEMDKHYPFDHGTQRRHGEADEAKSTIINMLANAPVIVPSNKEESE